MQSEKEYDELEMSKDEVKQKMNVEVTINRQNAKIITYLPIILRCFSLKYNQMF